MAAFSSNIDITSGGTYAMDVTNGETSSKVATDLNGKFANIQELLQNGLPEVWTGDSLPDSLPNGKIIYNNDNLYYGDNKRIATYAEIQNMKIATGYYSGNNTTNRKINVGFYPICVLLFSNTGYAGVDNTGAYHNVFGGMALRNYNLVADISNLNNKIAMQIVSNGFIVNYDISNEYYSCMTNMARYSYYYIAFR